MAKVPSLRPLALTRTSSMPVLLRTRLTGLVGRVLAAREASSATSPASRCSVDRACPS